MGNLAGDRDPPFGFPRGGGGVLGAIRSRPRFARRGAKRRILAQVLAGRRRVVPAPHRRPQGQRVQHEFLIAGRASHRSIGLAEEEAPASRFKGVRLQHQCDLPRLREKTLVDILIGLRKKDVAAGVRMVPTHGLPVGGVPFGQGHHLRQTRLVPRGERERRSHGVFAIERFVAGDRNPVAIPVPQQDSPDLGAAAGQRKEGVHHCQPDIVQHAGGIFDLERAFRCVPFAHCGVGADSMRFN